MIKTNLLKATPDREITQQLGTFSVMEYKRDISVTPEFAAEAFFSAQMNIHKKQLIANLADSGVLIQSGSMQLMIGDVKASTNVAGAGDLMKKVVGSKMTGETAIKPRYFGHGQVVMEPTFKHIILQSLANWNGSMVVENGMFLACDDTVQMKVAGRNTLSSMVLGKEGFFNLALKGQGVVALESPVPFEELIVVDLEDDCLKIDGNMAIAWSNTLKFTVEKTTRTLVGSGVSGEGLLNTYRGTGRVLLAPVQKPVKDPGKEFDDMREYPEE